MTKRSRRSGRSGRTRERNSSTCLSLLSDLGSRRTHHGHGRGRVFDLRNWWPPSHGVDHPNETATVLPASHLGPARSRSADADDIVSALGHDGFVAVKRARPYVDRVLVAQLSDAAVRLAEAGGPITEAVTELRQLAAEESDLLAQAAGILAGAWSADPSAHAGHRLVAAGLLVMAGADLGLLERWISEGRRRAQTPIHSA